VNEQSRAPEGTGFSPGSPTSWFVCEAGKTEGPLREQRIVQLIQWGKITARAYVCDEQLSSWVSIRRTAFAPLLEPSAATEEEQTEAVNPLGALRGGPWRLSRRAAQRLSGLLAALSVAAGALQLASGLAMSSQNGDVRDGSASAPAAPSLRAERAQETQLRLESVNVSTPSQ
jgi:uncharacterized protein DUF4339